MNRAVSLLLLVSLSSPAAAQTRVRPMGEFRADAKAVSFVATFEARSTGQLVLDVNQRMGEASPLSSSHCTAPADAVGRWADSTTVLVNQQIARPEAPEKIEYEGPELPSDDCVIRVDRTIFASGSQYSLVVRSRGLNLHANAAAPLAQAQALAFIGKLRGTADVTLAMSNIAPGSPANPSVVTNASPAQINAGQPYFEFQVEQQATPLPNNAEPAYPEMLKAAGVQGEVLAQFVVDTTGRAEMNTFKVLKSSHDLFTISVKSALLSMHFHPAEIAGRKVRQIVQMPFVFGLSKELDNDFDYRTAHRTLRASTQPMFPIR